MTTHEEVHDANKDLGIPGVAGAEGLLSPTEIGKRQVEVAQRWAEIYQKDRSMTGGGASTAEIVLRNPAVYAREVPHSSLPESLKKMWANLEKLAEALSVVADMRHTEWGDIGGLDRIQHMVQAGSLDSHYRGAAADIMVTSSDLFDRSTELVPGNSRYFADNVTGAEAWLAQSKRAA